MAERAAPAEPASRFYMAQRLRLHYADWGNAGAPPLILLHGGEDHCRNWDWIAPRLRDRFHVVAPDLRGHGDSQWSSNGHYAMAALVYDLARLADEIGSGPVRIVGHSLGGNVAVRFAGLYPDRVRRLVAIEGLGPSPARLAEAAGIGAETRLRDWIEGQRRLAGRAPRLFDSVEQAAERMHAANPHLVAADALHLTRHGVRRLEDGRFAWKFDPYVRSTFPHDLAQAELHGLWSRIECPVLLAYGRDSWASNPAEDGRMAHFRAARLALFDRAGHWVHHDRREAFLDAIQPFLED